MSFLLKIRPSGHAWVLIWKASSNIYWMMGNWKFSDFYSTPYFVLFRFQVSPSWKLKSLHYSLIRIPCTLQKPSKFACSYVPPINKIVRWTFSLVFNPVHYIQVFFFLYKNYTHVPINYHLSKAHVFKNPSCIKLRFYLPKLGLFSISLVKIVVTLTVSFPKTPTYLIIID